MKNKIPNTNSRLAKTFKQSGFSMIEIILAVGLFIILVSGTMGTVLNGYGLNRLSEEQNIATQYASEGIEAIKSIRNQSFATLNNTASTGLDQSGGTWTLSGTNNQFGPNNKFIRTISIESVNRDGSGNIVSSGGSLDGNTKKVTSTVAWNFSPTINDSVILTAFITNFRQAIGIPSNLLFYGKGITTPQYRRYDPDVNTFGAETASIIGAAPTATALRVSPTTSESVAGYVTSDGTLYILCFDGTNWSNEWNTNIGGIGTTRRFDIAYERSTGNVIVLYGTNVSTTNELAYRTKSGGSSCGSGNWSAATNLDPLRTSGTIQWVKLATDFRSSSSLIAASWADSNSDLSAAIWSGTTWTNEPTATTETSLEVAAAAQDVDSFDLAYESLSGDLMLIWGNSAGKNNTNGVRYRTCTGGTAGCTWNNVTTPPTFSDDATNLDLAAHPSTDEMVFASIGNAGADLQAGYWSGTTWTNQANIDTSSTAPAAGTIRVATGWLVSGATSRSIVVYDDGNGVQSNLSWLSGNGGSFNTESDFDATPAFNNDQGTYIIETDPNDLSRLLVIFSDNNNDLFAKRLVMTATPTFTWTDADGGIALEANLPQSISYPFAFNYQRSP